MKIPNKPVVCISKCLGFEACRYDGTMLKSKAVDSIMPFIDARPVCPELAIGLGVPRPVIRIIKEGERLRLFQPETGLDLTNRMENFVENFLSSIQDEVNGWILKARSPSCGLFDTKVFASLHEDAKVVGKGPGFLGKGVLAAFPDLAVNEELLEDPLISNAFLEKLLRV